MLSLASGALHLGHKGEAATAWLMQTWQPNSDWQRFDTTGQLAGPITKNTNTQKLIYITVSHSSAVALASVVRAILDSYGRPPTLTTCSSETAETMDTKICKIDYVAKTSK
jgi:hypothetical protein